MFSAGSEDTESDVLPFALDAEIGSQPCPSPSMGLRQDGPAAAAAAQHAASFVPHASTAGERHALHGGIRVLHVFGARTMVGMRLVSDTMMIPG